MRVVAGEGDAAAAEARRLARLHELQLLDTAAEPMFDRLARLASQVAGTPIALISLVDAQRQWFKANVGLQGTEQTPRAVAFCAHTIGSDAMFEVADAQADQRFADNPLVTGEPGIRFYAGVPLTLAGGERIGTLCVIDRQPRHLSAGQHAQLVELGRTVVHAIELREQARRLDGALEALAASEAKYRLLSDALPIGVYHADGQGRGTYTNPSWQETAGLTHAQSLGEGWAQAIHPGDRAELFARWSEALAREQRFSMRLRMQRPDGAVRVVESRAQPQRDDTGRLIGYVGYAEDVTERQAAQAALERSNAELRQLYELTPAKLHSIDTEGRIVTVSEAWLDRLGYRREEVLGRRSVDFLTPASREAVLSEHLPQLWSRGRSDQLPLQMVHRDGSVLDVLLSAVLVVDDKGRPHRALAVVKDVTEVLARAAELRREQAARREIERQATELERLAGERSHMLDLLAHEVRQPLNNASAAIQSAGALLAAKGEQAASARLERAQGVLAEVQGHVENTLALSALLADAGGAGGAGGAEGAGEADRGAAAAAVPAAPEEEADIDTVLAVAVAELPVAERGRVAVRRLTAARTALMDSSLVRLALRNLLGNAVRHTAPGTPVQLCISDSEAPLALCIDVTDQGPGLPPELLPRLFERGNRVRHADGRTSHGLGLFIAHRALRAQGGELRLLHSGADGTAWRLVLPQGGGG
ncbi:MAG: PAS domain S-box protein [Rubrivivax sp.]|nr:PAS domain S-box protein [Rubrivivax sp.]